MQKERSILLVTAVMGLGHIRALKPLEGRLSGDIIVMGQTGQASRRLERIWGLALNIYEWFSRFSQIPFLGKLLFWFLDRLLYIHPFSDRVDQSKSNYQVRILERALKLGICKELDLKMEGNPIVITSFYAPVAYLAKEFPEATVFCQICDSDLSRAWVPRNPKAKKVYYFATCSKSVERLKAYGVEHSHIFLTGLPLPHMLVGGEKQEVANKNYQRRLSFFTETRSLSKDNSLKIVYALGGANAMLGYGKQLALGLKKLIRNGSIVFIFIPSPNSYILKNLKRFKEKHFPSSLNFEITSTNNRLDYFNIFDEHLTDVHILWTKPSEFTFYSGLGIPIIMAPPLGSQEKANSNWLLTNGMGIEQNNPRKCESWLLELLDSGELARMAQNGWAYNRRNAIYEIERIVNTNISAN